ncbi:SDR family NAD(P)-dependent oxidoreductase [Pseudofrankia asymbiotica]|uniref:Short-chain dehydrogenase n=1 Tax=Pseudofrankia asymbiotica TaxID=1834516 RepID=A0A1V2I7J2_9ACTN|nr:SDR family NAD(P)-dependent oxidoreductase [Pseudofrankia asymbiotica]ONH28014.1 hypothetical protein BL253_20635 [Pseudofrankia asymbiotica]
MDTTPGALTGRAVVVTGAGRGIGEACARHAAELGAAVVVNDVDADVAVRVAAGIVAAGGRALAQPGDVSDWTAAEALVARCVAEFGAMDGLLNNAGIMRLARPEELDEATLRRVVEVNLLGAAFRGARAARTMVTQGPTTSASLGKR